MSGTTAAASATCFPDRRGSISTAATQAASAASATVTRNGIAESNPGRRSRELPPRTTMRPLPVLLSSPSPHVRLPQPPVETGLPERGAALRPLGSGERSGEAAQGCWSPLFRRAQNCRPTTTQVGGVPTPVGLGLVAFRRAPAVLDAQDIQESSSSCGAADGDSESMSASRRLAMLLGPPLPFLKDIDPTELEEFRAAYQAFRSGRAEGARGEIGWIANETQDEARGSTRNANFTRNVNDQIPGIEDEFDDDAVYFSEPEIGMHGSRSPISSFTEPRRSPTLGPQPLHMSSPAPVAKLLAPPGLLADPSASPETAAGARGGIACASWVAKEACSAGVCAPTAAAAADGCCASAGGGVVRATAARLDFLAWLGDEMRGRPDEAQLQRVPRNQLVEVAKAPWRIEKLLGFGFLICLDILLHELSFTPLRVARALPRLLFGQRLSVTEQCDALRFSLLLLNVCLVSILIDVSYVYHYIRGESFLKLYVIFNMLEMFERWFRSVGMDLFDIVMISVRRPWRVLLPRVLVTLFYCLVHSTMHLLRVLLLNVAINTSSSAVFLIIVTNNFGEIKSTVFKRYEAKSLFPIITSDIVERFYLALDILFVLARLSVSPHRGMYSPSNIASHMCVLVLMELGTDWIKFCLILKFSEMKAATLDVYKEVLVADILLSRASRLPGAESRPATTSGVKQDSPQPPPVRPDMPFRGILSFSHVPARRIGFCGVPLSTLVVVHFAMLARSPCGAVLPQPRATAAVLLFSVFMIGLLAKVLLSALLFGCAARRRRDLSKGAELFPKIRAL